MREMVESDIRAGAVALYVGPGYGLDQIKNPYAVVLIARDGAARDAIGEPLFYGLWVNNRLAIDAECSCRNARFFEGGYVLLIPGADR